MVWKQRPPKTVFLSQEPVDTWITEKIVNNATPGFNSRTDNNRLILDIGFYQKDVWQNTDFGLTLRNLIGYTWTKEHSDYIFGTDTLKNSSGIDSLIIENYHYIAEDHKNKGWISGKYKIIAAGLVYHTELANGSFKLSFPMDIEILGLFDKNMKNRFVFKGGVQAGIGQFLYARIGYARQPGPIQSRFAELKNANVFTGGAGVAISRFKLDFFMSKNSFGTSAAFEY
jgi:hypothetical protein